VIPPFVDAIDNACSWLAPDGFLGVSDFFVSARYDVPMRQMSWGRRFFWRSIFDIDNIDIGPERRQYLETKMEVRLWGCGGVFAGGAHGASCRWEGRLERSHVFRLRI